uniref:Nuclear pore complex protein n=1 Tax=Panagrolaimus sp. JU765 TaxID=591449 RepID=A0AC34RCS5_9BILA
MEVGSQNNTFLNDTANTSFPSRNSLGFNATVLLSEDTDKFAQVFHDIILDFHTICLDGGHFADVVERFCETASNGVLIFNKLSENGNKGGKRIARIKQSLQMERNLFDLILKLHKAEIIAELDDENDDTLLKKIFKKNVHFRKLITVLHWSEEVAFTDPTGFSQLINELNEAGNGHPFVDSVKNRQFAHMDSSFLGNLSDSDWESMERMKKFCFSLLRCGRLQILDELLNKVGLSSLKVFVEVRKALSNPELSTLDFEQENYGFTEARMHFKNMANHLLNLPDEMITPIDQCIWATLGGNLSTLLAHAENVEDIFWSYLNCSVESILDAEVIKAKHVTNLDLLTNLENGEDMRSMENVFRTFFNHIDEPYYKLVCYFAGGLFEKAVDLMYETSVGHELDVDPNRIRLYTHCILLIQNGKYEYNRAKADAVIRGYTKVLTELGLYSTVPYYLSRLDGEEADKEMVKFLYALDRPDERIIVLNVAGEIDTFDVGKLCIKTFEKAKEENSLDEGEVTAEAVAKLQDIWKFLLFFPEKTSIDALVECNNILRKLFVRDRLGEAMELLSISDQNLVVLSEGHLRKLIADNPDDNNIESLVRYVQDQQREYNSYILYLEIMDKFTVWQGKFTTQLPRQPEKMSDTEYARLDAITKNDYERRMKNAQEKLSAHKKSVEEYKNSVISQIHELIEQTSTWMVCCVSETDVQDKEAYKKRKQEIIKVHERYLFYTLTMLIRIYQDTCQDEEAVQVGDLLMNSRYDLHTQLSKENLRKLLKDISKSGHVLSINGE